MNTEKYDEFLKTTDPHFVDTLEPDDIIEVPVGEESPTGYTALNAGDIAKLQTLLKMKRMENLKKTKEAKTKKTNIKHKNMQKISRKKNRKK